MNHVLYIQGLRGNGSTPLHQPGAGLVHKVLALLSHRRRVNGPNAEWIGADQRIWGNPRRLPLNCCAMRILRETRWPNLLSLACWFWR